MGAGAQPAFTLLCCMEQYSGEGCPGGVARILAGLSKVLSEHYRLVSTVHMSWSSSSGAWRSQANPSEKNASRSYLPSCSFPPRSCPLRSCSRIILYLCFQAAVVTRVLMW